MTRPKCQNMLRWSGQNANQKVGMDKMPTTEISPDKMPTFGWHYVRLAFCPVGILSAHQLDSRCLLPRIDLFKYSIIQLQKWCCARPKNNGRGHCRQQILFWAWEMLLQPLVTILFGYFGQSPLRNVATARWLSPSCHSPLFCGPRRRGTELMQILSDRININIIIFTIIPTIIHAIIHAWQV